MVGETHYLVAKREEPASAGKGEEVKSTEAAFAPETVLALLEGEERIAEVARMLSGDASEASLAHAAEMLARAAR